MTTTTRTVRSIQYAPGTPSLPEYAAIPDARRAHFRRRTGGSFRPARHSTAERARGAPARDRRRRTARFPALHRRDPRRQMEGRAHSGRPAGPARRNHRPHRSQDDHQRPQFRCKGVHGRLRGLAVAGLGQRRARADQPARRPRRGASISSAPKARPTSSAINPPC